MAFTPRNFEQILTDMVAYVQATTVISDFNPGSVIRTILEAAALEDDEQYFQMQQILDAFSIVSARGTDLDLRLADFGLFRRNAVNATCHVRFFDNNLVSDQVSADVAAGATTISVFDSTAFPTSGFPYVIRAGERTSRAQNLTVTANNTTLGTFTLNTATKADLSLGDRVSLVTGSSSYTVNTGTIVKTPPTVSEPSRTFTTQEPAYIVQGNFFSNEVIVKADTPGPTGNVAPQVINRFSGSPPFTGAGVVNFDKASGGLARETDSEFRARALNQLQSLSRGTPLSLKASAVGVTDIATGQRCTSANVLEDFTADEVFVYIDDGTGLTPDVQPLPVSSLNGALGVPGLTTLTLNDTTAFPSSGTVLVLGDGVNLTELVTYTTKDDTAGTLTLSSGTVSAHANASIVLFVDVITDSAELGRRRFSSQNFPIVRGTERIFVNEGVSWVELTPSVDYVLNRGTGEFQLTDLGGVALGSSVVCSYNYYTNLISAVQRVLEGDASLPAQYPGVKAAGVFLAVEAPIIRRIPISITLSAERGYREQDLVTDVRTRVEQYISSLTLGDNVIVSKIVDIAHNVPGVRDVNVVLPTANVSILENELPTPFAADGTTLVSVT